jgi:outer membrane murein-binding lipoprotein Lpp
MALNKEETEVPWQKSKTIFTDEDKFRALIVKDNDAIGMVNALGGELSQKTPELTSQVSTFEGDLAGLRADLNALAGNSQAVQDALNIAQQMTSSNLAQDATRAQIKARLIAFYAAGTKAVLDDAEINQLTTEYAKIAQRSGVAANAVREAQTALNDFWTAAEKQANELTASDCKDDPIHEIVIACIARHLDKTYSPQLEQDYTRLNQDLPDAEADINQQQSTLLSRANFIYDHSQVLGFMQKAIDLGGVTGNLRVYSTIYETETFPRFTIPPVTTNVVAAASPVSLPTAVGVPPPAPTTPATQSTHPSGTPIPVPEFEVHDRYKATMVAAFAISSVKEFNITTQSITTGNASTSTAANPVSCTVAVPCTQIFVSGPSHNSVIAGLSYHPAGYDTFPGARHFGRKQLKEAFGIVGGLSVQDFNDYFYGLDLQVAHGIQIMGGGNAFRQTALAPGFSNNGIYQGPTTFTGPDKWSNGGFFGIGLNLSIFRKSFGKITGLGTSTATTTGS